MKSDILNPKALFQKNVRYMIPPFQRPYVWDEEEQWAPLWDDVQNTAERYLDELEILGPEYAADAEQKTRSHFLGAVVLQQQSTATIDIEQRLVIDGQQRLTTIQLLLDAAVKVFQNYDLEPAARRLSKLVLNDEDFIGSDPDDAFKVWPTVMDRDAFREVIHGESPEANTNGSSVAQAHGFFQIQIEQWIAAEPDAFRLKASALETALTGLLETVVIDLEPGDEAHVIFETLNARGTPLIESDLIKNLVLYQATNKGLDEDEVYRSHWMPLEDDWWRQDIRQGRIVRPRLDVFLNYWLSMRTVTDVQSSKVFETFRNYSDSKNVISVAADVRDSGAIYRSLETLTNPDESKFIYRWRVMDAGVITPLLLRLFSASSEELPAERRVRALKAVESFLVRRMICRFTTKDYNRLVLDLGEVLRDEGIENADDTIISFFGRQSAMSREWPTDEQLRESFLNLPLYRLLTRGRLRLVLEGIEEALRTQGAEQQSAPQNLTIEHIMPQGWRTHWPIPDQIEDIATAALERDRDIHTIGNLTLLNGYLNPLLSNGPWPEKRDGLEEHSVLFLNKNLLENSSADKWDESTIHNRGERLAEIATRVWPRPAIELDVNQ